MRLSEAILLGSTLRKQGFKKLIDDEGGSCAFGAAFEATGQHSLRYWPWLLKEALACPIEECKHWSPYGASVISHLNDFHKWPRERIAEWVATVEPVEPSAPTCPDNDKVPEAVCA